MCKEKSIAVGKGKYEADVADCVMVTRKLRGKKGSKKVARLFGRRDKVGIKPVKQ